MKNKKEFDAEAYKQEWKKKNMKSVHVKYKTGFVQEYQDALKILGLKNSDVMRDTMQKIIEQAKNKE